MEKKEPAVSDKMAAVGVISKLVHKAASNAGMANITVESKGFVADAAGRHTLRLLVEQWAPGKSALPIGATTMVCSAKTFVIECTVNGRTQTVTNNPGQTGPPTLTTHITNIMHDLDVKEARAAKAAKPVGVAKADRRQ